MAAILIDEKPTPNVAGPTSDAPELGFVELFELVWLRKKLVLAICGAAALVSSVIALLLPSIFTATTSILPPQQSQSSAMALVNQNLTGLLGMGSGVAGMKNPSDVYVAMLRSRSVADALIKRFDLKALFDTTTLEDTRRELEARSAIGAGREGMVFITFDDPDPNRAAAIANAYVEELDRLSQSLAITEASQRRLFFEKQLKLANESLAHAESALKTTQEKTGLIKLDDQGKAILEAIARLRATIAEREVQLAAMRTFATPTNPEYLLVQEQVKGLQAELAKLNKANPSSQDDLFLSARRVPEAGLEYVRRLRDVKYHETMLEMLARQYELAKVDEAKDAPVIQIVDRAVAPDKKSKPRRSLIVLGTTLAAAVAAVLLVLFLEMMRLYGGSARRREPRTPSSVPQ
jgi:tyrosine-protein kinase Etk/Wzc